MLKNSLSVIAESDLKNAAAKKLLYVLGSYDSFLEGSPGSRPILDKYNDFKEVLEYLANGKCNGCREDHCMNSNCIIPKCTEDRGILFCFECKDFPCDKTGFPTGLREKWIRKNNKITRKKRRYPIMRAE